MATTLSGPMFERSRSGPWTSSHDKDGAHYNTYGCRDENGMAALREMFESGEANEFNFVLFSTSGVHGTYSTIEDAERIMANGGIDPEYPDDGPTEPSVTFLIVHPRIVCLRYGNCIPRNSEDIEFLKKLRASSWAVTQAIGKDGEE